MASTTNLLLLSRLATFTFLASSSLLLAAGAHKEKRSNYILYFHDIHNEPGATSYGVVSSPVNGSATNFGLIDMFDNPLTAGPNMSSALVGRAQGFYGSASLDYDGLATVMNLVFLDKKHNGSYLTVVGRNKVFDDVRELPVVGGAGDFRMARGYLLVSTAGFNTTAGGIIAKFNVTVFHY